MLTLQERHRILKLIRYFYTVFLLPVKVDVQKWEIHQATSTKWKGWAFKVSSGLFMSHAVYKIVRLFWVLFFLRNPAPLHQVIVHADLVICCVTMAIWYYFLFMKNPDVFVGILQITLTGNFGQGKD